MTTGVRAPPSTNLSAAMKQIHAHKKIGFLELANRVLAIAMLVLFGATLAILILSNLGYTHPYTSFYTLGGCGLLIIPIALVSCQRERVAKEGGVNLKARDKHFFKET